MVDGGEKGGEGCHCGEAGGGDGTTYDGRNDQICMHIRMFVMRSARSGEMMNIMISVITTMMTGMTMYLKVVDVMREDPSVDMASVLQLLEERQGKLARLGDNISDS